MLFSFRAHASWTLRAKSLSVFSYRQTVPAQRLRFSLVFRGGAKIWLEIESGDDAIIGVIIRCELGRSFRVGAVRLLQSVCIWVRRGRQVVRQRSAKPAVSYSVVRNQRLTKTLNGVNRR